MNNNNRTENNDQAEQDYFSIDSLPYQSTPYPLYKKIRHLPLPVLLASGNDRDRKDSRFEFISAKPDKVLRTTGTTTSIETPGHKTVEVQGNPLDILSQELTLESDSPQNNDLPFTGGAIGYLGYELLHPWLSIKQDHKRDIDMPDMLIGIYSW